MPFIILALVASINVVEPEIAPTNIQFIYWSDRVQQAADSVLIDSRRPAP
jgi:hypothetical protein